MKICVVGTGSIGSSIIQVFAQSGFLVLMKGRSDSSIDKSYKLIEKNLDQLLNQNLIDESKKQKTLQLISSTLSYVDIADYDIVIEAIAENMVIKKGVIKELDSICKKEAIIASSTLSLSITELSQVTSNPERVIGMHFFKPVIETSIIEVIRGMHTSDKVFETILDLSSKINKKPIPVNEAPGFVVNRILVPMINEAIGILYEGIADVSEIDLAMKLGANHKKGPLEIADIMGLDVCLEIMQALYTETCDPKYRPHVLLRKMVRANMLGVKTGIGFYKY